MPAAGQHIAHFIAALLQHMLHIDLFGAIARERGMQAGQHATCVPVLQLLAIQVVVLALLLAEHQVHFALAGGGLQLLHQAHQRRDAGAGADQQKGSFAGIWQMEAGIGAAVHTGMVAAVQQAAGGSAEALATAQGVAYFAHAQAELVVAGVRGDRIGARQSR
ncbi:hypothetical protein PGKDCPLP_03586 [Stenotrophomonas maltophilia]|nr:hypothetical protein PGKDCPLP_03586 [Stenotrophomonas maltophilia]